MWRVDLEWDVTQVQKKPDQETLLALQYVLMLLSETNILMSFQLFFVCMMHLVTENDCRIKRIF